MQPPFCFLIPPATYLPNYANLTCNATFMIQNNTFDDNYDNQHDHDKSPFIPAFSCLSNSILSTPYPAKTYICCLHISSFRLLRFHFFVYALMRYSILLLFCYYATYCYQQLSLSRILGLVSGKGLPFLLPELIRRFPCYFLLVLTISTSQAVVSLLSYLLLSTV